MKTPTIAIFDIGKTNKKLFLFNENYEIVYEKSTQFDEITDEDGDPCEDVELLSKWVVNTFDEVLQKLVDGGNSMVVIEHNLDVIKTADYIIDMGPEGGFGGGKIVAAGTPEEVAKVKESFTGQYLKALL